MVDEVKTAAEKAASAQGVKPADANDSNAGGGNPAPAAIPAEAPTPEPTAEEKAAAEKKVADEKAAEELKAKEAEGDDTNKEDAPLDIATWGSTGHEAADSALTLLQNAGVTPEEAKVMMFDAVMAGDIASIDRAALEAKVGKDRAVLIMAGVTTFVNDKNTRNEQIVADIKEASGGEENWNKMTAWSKGQNAEGKPNVSDENLNDWRDMIDEGGAKARFAVNELAAAFNADAANSSIAVSNANPALDGDTRAATTARAISRTEFAEELNKANRQNASQAVIDEIHAARHTGRNKGI